ncbi:MAG TPA: isocitrate lyase/phosphoenolpyruvate mutase family protein [Candidatus Agrococcus pullicola]|uniref:Isocitrate lyase/phosphoenolpyruvate mutase family protein n=1 Tax=Candidatus Agrococcus pullicola TaxID=2838429 RepID=A0A9D1YWL2_9MICO|nr:isocitrate lyase/phosphoenolpyruvate mutase family protein [Candidatus Agrococcus pullicola]
MEILDDPRFVVAPVPDADEGVAWLRAHVARFSEGIEHERRRALTLSLLDAIEPSSLRRPGHPVATLAEAMGLPRATAADIEVVTACYQPHEPVTAEADAAVARLVAVAGNAWDEATAARIGILIQACAATRSMIAGNEPPVPATRRISPAGKEIVVSLEGGPFGAGRHECPGRDHALALAEGARSFRELHRADDPLLLPGAWDFASAAAFVRQGFRAVGTTSLGVAAAHGLPDADGATHGETIALAKSLVRLPVPVSIDVEGGFDLDPASLAAELTTIGVAGVNIEDGRGSDLVSMDQQSAAISAIKSAAPELFVNARVDTYWLGVSAADTTRRAMAYAEAGADGVFIPGLRDRKLIAELVESLGEVPLNLLAELPLQQLRDLGVRRVSTGSLPFRAALTQAVSTVDIYRSGGSVPEAMSYEEAEGLCRVGVAE